jgi:hypothetical protein
MAIDSEALASPSLLPMALDLGRGRARFIAIDEERYRSASFLDAPHLQGAGPDLWIDWPDVVRTAAALSGGCDFIFHIGHVGSTLVSRLLGVNQGVFSLREPCVLRDLARAEFARPAPRTPAGQARIESLVEVLLRLLGRVYRPEQRSLIKPTSYVANFAPALLKARLDARVILLVTGMEAYAATILRTQAGRRDIAGSAPLRLGRLHARLGGEIWRLAEMSEGEVVAMSWLSGCMALRAIAGEVGDRALWVDFDDLLDRPDAVLSDALRLLRDRPCDADVEEIMRSPDWSRYAKDRQAPFDARSRARARQTARADHAAEIARADAWLALAAREHEDIARALADTDEAPASAPTWP